MTETNANLELREQKKEALLNYMKNFSKSYMKLTNKKQGGRGRQRLNDYTSEDVKDFLSDPEGNSSRLVDLSIYLYNTSATYNKIVNFYSTLPTFAYVIEPKNFIDTNEVDMEVVRKNYIKALEVVENMSIRHEMQKLMKSVYKEDIFYGYEIETKDSYFIRKMDRTLCELTAIEDGVFNYAFDFSYFEGNEEELEYYPEEFSTLYNEVYLKKKGKEKGFDGYIELSSKHAFAIKYNEDVLYALPPFVSSMESALDEEGYRKIKKDKDAMDNFMALVQKIPLNDDDQSLDVFRIDIELAMQFHQMAESLLPQGAGIITSPMDIEAIKLEKSKRDDDLVMIAKDNTLSNAGLPPNIFSTTNKTAGGIKYAVQYLEQMSFAPLRQLERWINRKLKRLSGRHKFELRFVDVTNYSREDVFKRMLQAAQYGYATKQEVAASLDISPMDLHNKLYLENDILGLDEKMIPLNSAHTQTAGGNTGEKERGREAKDDQEVSESTEVWRENRTE